MSTAAVNPYVLPLPPRSPPHPQGTTLKQAALKLGHCTEAEFEAWVRPEDMLGPK